jgi:hypothetical protein
MIRKSGKPDFEMRACPAGALAQQRVEQKRPLLARRRHGIALGIKAGFRSNGLRGRRGIRRRAGGSRHLGRSSGDRRRGGRRVRRRGYRGDGRSGRQFGSAVAPTRRQSKTRDHDCSKRQSSALTHSRERGSRSPVRRDQPGPCFRRHKFRRYKPQFASIKGQWMPQGRLINSIADQRRAATLCRQRLASTFTLCFATA